MSKENSKNYEEAQEFGRTFFNVPTALSILQNPTPKDLIQKKEQKRGPALDYVSASTVIRTLNKAFGLRWSFRIHETRVVESQEYYEKEQGPVVQTLGELTVPGLGSRMQWGSQSVIGGQQNQEHAFKGSASDAMKKCAAMFLVHLDLADGGPRPETGVGPNDLPSFDLEQAQQSAPAPQAPEAPQASAQAPEAPKQEQPAQTPAQPVNQATHGSEARIPEDVEIPQAVQESIDSLPEEPAVEQQKAPVEPKPVEQSNQNASMWSKEDVMELKGHKERLGIETNEALNPYIQTFFGNDQMTFRQLTPVTIKDFNHYLSGQ